MAEKLPLSEIQKTQEFQRATKKQQLFLAIYIAGGVDTGNYDAVEATFVAYKVKDRATAHRMSYAILSSIQILDVLYRHFGAEPPEAFRVMLRRAIRNKHLTPAQVKALRLKAEILRQHSSPGSVAA